MSQDEPFGRQPQPVVVTLTGESQDINYWAQELARRAQFKGDVVVFKHANIFTIHPRAVND